MESVRKVRGEALLMKENRRALHSGGGKISRQRTMGPTRTEE